MRFKETGRRTDRLERAFLRGIAEADHEIARRELRKTFTYEVAALGDALERFGRDLLEPFEPLGRYLLRPFRRLRG